MTDSFDVIVDNSYDDQNIGILNGSKVYKTLGAALKDAKAELDRQYVILIKPGRYYEKLVIDKPNIRLMGEDAEKTYLAYDAASGTIKPDGSTYGTTGSASITIICSGFKAENITFENGFDYRANEYKIAADPSKVSGSQAVALKTAPGSDGASFLNCRFLGFQDTLYTDAGTQYFKDCYIEGNVDFIFGAGQALFEDCTIASIGREGSINNGYITAPSTLVSNKYGMIFYNCRLIKANSDTSDHSVALGRPWHPGTTFPDGKYANPNAVGSSVFIDCFMDSHIKSEGWDKMSGKDKDGNTVWFMPDNIEHSRFFEYGSTGPGAVKEPSAQRKFLSAEEAEKFMKVIKNSRISQREI